MAVLLMRDGTRQFVKGEVATGIWMLLNAEAEGTEQQIAFASDVEHVYLNWRTAPESWLLANREAVTETVQSYWDRDETGEPYRVPDNDPDVERVSEALGLVVYGVNVARLQSVSTPINELNERD